MAHAGSVDSTRREQLEAWLREAQDGCLEARGRLLDACRDYLDNLARQEVSQQLRADARPSDLVQETELDAHRDFAQFQGERLEELLAWLRKILLNNAVSVRRRYELAAKRNVSREISLDRAAGISGRLQDDAPSPRSALGRIEIEQQVARALARLPADQQSVVLSHSRDHRSFAEIAAQMERSTDAVRKLWFRGIEQLRRELLTFNERT